MIRGILSDKAAQFEGEIKNKSLYFKCPKCGGIHFALVSKEGIVDRGGYGNTWHYRYHDNPVEGKVKIRIDPSYNNKKNCGWHSSSPWDVEVVLTTGYNEEDEFLQEWLDGKHT